MSALAPLPKPVDLLAALRPAGTPSTPSSVACAPGVAASFESVLLEARAQAPAQAPAELPDLDDRKDTPTQGDPFPQVPLPVPVPDGSALAQLAVPEPLGISEVDVEPVEADEPRASAPQAGQTSQPVDPAPLLLSPSLVNLVIGTAAGLLTPQAEGAAPDAPAPRAEPVPERRAHAPGPASPASESHPLPARGLDFQSLEVAPPARETDPRTGPRHDPAPDSPAARQHEPDAQIAPARDAAAPADPLAHRTAQADAALRAAQASTATPSAAPALADVASGRDTSAPAHAARALPELPARGEIEVVRSVRVLAEQGGGRVHIRLDPPELGGLSLRVVVSDGAVHVSMLADQSPVADLLQRHSAELRSALEGHGLRLDQLDVGTGQADLGSRDAHPRESDERETFGGRGSARRFDPIVLPARRFDVSTLGAVDLHV